MSLGWHCSLPPPHIFSQGPAPPSAAPATQTPPPLSGLPWPRRSTTHATGAHTVAELFRTQRPAGGPGAGALDVVDGRRLAAVLRALAPMGDALQA